MRVFVLSALALGGCVTPAVDVDHESVALARGTSQEIAVTVDGYIAPVRELYWTVDDDELVTVTPSEDGHHLLIGGNHEGDTVVHVSTHGDEVEIPTHVAPAALLSMWTEPSAIAVMLGDQIQVHAKALNTLAEVVDVTGVSRWDVRDTSIVQLDTAGMMVHAMEAGRTTISAVIDGNAAVVPVAVFK